MPSWVMTVKEHTRGDGLMDIEGVAGVGILSRGLTSGAEKSADKYYQYMLAELKVHKDAKTWLLTTSAREQQRANNLILGNINSAVAVKCFYFMFQIHSCIFALIVDTNFFLFSSLGIPVSRRKSNATTSPYQSDFPSVPDHDGTSATPPTAPDRDGIMANAPPNNGGNCQPLVMPPTTHRASAGSFPVPCP
jgi:hypothetical protein